MILAIDTSTETASLALTRGDGDIAAVLTWRAGRNHTMELHPAIDQLLCQAKAAPGDLTGIVVTLGPGSFTGIRIGLATAKGLALGLDIPIVGVETLAAAANAFAWTGRAVWSVVGVGRRQLGAAAYQQADDGGVTKVHEESIVTPAELCDLIIASGAESLLTGEFDDDISMMMRERVGDSLVIPPYAPRIRSAIDAAHLGHLRLMHGDADDVITLEPFYLRPPAAVERAAEAAARQSGG